MKDCDWGEVQEFYNLGKTWKDISEKFSVGTNAIANAVKNGLLKTRSREENFMLNVSKGRIRTYHKELNIDYFGTIDTKDKAYWLGFLYADGCITKHGQLTVCLSIKDEFQIDRFIKELNGDISKKKYYGPYKTAGKSVSITFTCNKLVSDLEKLGCVHRKSKVIELPNFESVELDLAFLLGYFDGDGTQNGSVLCCGNKQFLQQIKDKYGIDTKLIEQVNKGGGTVYKMSLGMDLFRKMCAVYKNSMSRKRALNSNG